MADHDDRATSTLCLYGLLVVVLLAGAWTLVYAGGGTRTALPHVFYVPVVVAATTLGVRAALATGLAAMLLCGPLMPLDTAAGIAQSTGNWLTRGVFLVVVGLLTGVGVRTTTRRQESDIAERLSSALRPRDPNQGTATTGPRREEILRVLDARDFRTVFQPVVDLRTGMPHAYEALTRFPGVHPPDQWFAAAASHSLGQQLELATLRAALDAADTLPADVGLAVNVSPCLLLDPLLGQLLNEHGGGRPITVEVTEHALVADYETLVLAVQQLRALGVRVSVDDAGAGFSSMQHVLRLRPNELKLDMSITQGVADDPVRAALGEALIGFARDVGIRLVVEGIETPEDLTVWRGLGADAAQGYLLGRPGPAPTETTVLMPDVISAIRSR